MSKIHILTNGGELQTSVRLGYPTQKKFGDYAHEMQGKIVVRWGNSKFVYNRDASRKVDFPHVINRARFIKVNCNKLNSSKILATLVNVPGIYEKVVPQGVVVVVRALEHAAGEGFSIKEGPFKIEPGTYATKFIKTDHEYRVWFCGDRTMCAKRARMERNGPAGEHPCRSNWGYEDFSTVSAELHYQTLMSAKKIGLDCGAADVLFLKGKYYFLELNSAPAIDHRKLIEFYQKSLEILAKQKYPELYEGEKIVSAPMAPSTVVPGVVPVVVRPPTPQINRPLVKPVTPTTTPVTPTPVISRAPLKKNYWS